MTTGRQRIEELANQSGIVFDKFGMALPAAGEVSEGIDLDLFITAIVTECANIAFKLVPSEESALTIANAIETHFGVD